jgi:hypothetical protein
MSYVIVTDVLMENIQRKENCRRMQRGSPDEIRKRARDLVTAHA